MRLGPSDDGGRIAARRAALFRVGGEWLLVSVVGDVDDVVGVG